MLQRGLGTPGELEPNPRGAGCVHMLGLCPWQNHKSQKHKLSQCHLQTQPSGSPEPGHTVFHGHHGVASPNPASGKLSFPRPVYFTGSNIQLAEVLPKGKLDLKPIPRGASESSESPTIKHLVWTRQQETQRANSTEIWSSTLGSWPSPPALRTTRTQSLNAHLLVRVLSPSVSTLGSLPSPVQQFSISPSL